VLRFTHPKNTTFTLFTCSTTGCILDLFTSPPRGRQLRIGANETRRFEGSIEFSIIERTDNRVVSEMPIHTGIKNPIGVVQADALIWLVDVTAPVLVIGSEQALRVA
jgi:hypothetical protein